MPKPTTAACARTTARGTRRCRGCCAPRPALEPHQHKFLIPTLHFQLGPAQVKKALAETMRAPGRHAGARATAPWMPPTPRSATSRNKLLEAGQRALADPRRRPASPAWSWLGRSYNIYDRSVNCDIPRKLRHRYGANVIPLDFLVTGREPVGDLHANMFWISGRKILEAARIAAARPNLHLVYISNFKCGPDSYIKHFTREAAGAPLLVLQFDGHGNDAGYMTRCEAYLDSKGILRCYQSSDSRQQPSRRPSTKRQEALHSAHGVRQRPRLCGRRSAPSASTPSRRRPPTTARANWAPATPPATNAIRPR